MKKWIYFRLLACLMLLLVGCGYRLNEEKISELVKDALREKYNKQFVIQMMYYKPMDGTFDGRYYVFECTDIDGAESFSVQANGVGTHIKDNYEGNLYGKDIEADIQNILSQMKGISCVDSEIYFIETEEKFGSFEEYVKSGNAELDAKISLSVNDEYIASERVFALIDALQQKGYHYDLQVAWKDGFVYFAKRGIKPDNNTKQDIDKGFKIQ